MMGHKICLFGEIRKTVSELYLLLHLIWSSGFGLSHLIQEAVSYPGSLILEVPFAHTIHTWNVCLIFFPEIIFGDFNIDRILQIRSC